MTKGCWETDEVTHFDSSKHTSDAAPAQQLGDALAAQGDNVITGWCGFRTGRVLFGHGDVQEQHDVEQERHQSDGKCGNCDRIRLLILVVVFLTQVAFLLQLGLDLRNDLVLVDCFGRLVAGCNNGTVSCDGLDQFRHHHLVLAIGVVLDVQHQARRDFGDGALHDGLADVAIRAEAHHVELVGAGAIHPQVVGSVHPLDHAAAATSAPGGLGCVGELQVHVLRRRHAQVDQRKIVVECSGQGDDVMVLPLDECKVTNCLATWWDVAEIERNVERNRRRLSVSLRFQNAEVLSTIISKQHNVLSIRRGLRGRTEAGALLDVVLGDDRSTDGIVFDDTEDVRRAALASTSASSVDVLSGGRANQNINLLYAAGTGSKISAVESTGAAHARTDVDVLIFRRVRHVVRSLGFLVDGEVADRHTGCQVHLVHDVVVVNSRVAVVSKGVMEHGSSVGTAVLQEDLFGGCRERTCGDHSLVCGVGIATIRTSASHPNFFTVRQVVQAERGGAALHGADVLAALDGEDVDSVGGSVKGRCPNILVAVSHNIEEEASLSDRALQARPRMGLDELGSVSGMDLESGA
mmetsp:Transcript_6967/g.20444  ORF Transcript_6967/g.20444 Transcript_6967/m.20444 type:complete len:578 (+) Transcript_6967:50-1783(+)